MIELKRQATFVKINLEPPDKLFSNLYDIKFDHILIAFDLYNYPLTSWKHIERLGLYDIKE